MYSIICMIDVAWTFGPSGCAWAGPGPGKMEAPADVRSAWWPCTAHDSERRCGDVWIHRIRAAGNNMNSTCNSEMAVSSNKVAKDEEIWYIYIYDEEFVVWGVLNFWIQLLFVDQCMFSMSSLHISKRGCCMFLPIWHNLTDAIHVVLPNSRPFFWESFLNTPYKHCSTSESLGRFFTANDDLGFVTFVKCRAAGVLRRVGVPKRKAKEVMKLGFRLGVTGLGWDG